MYGAVAAFPLLVCSTPVSLFTLRSALQRRALPTAVGTVVSLVVMVLFFRRMAARYERVDEASH